MKIALDVLSIVKDCKNKEDMIKIIKMGKDVADSMIKAMS